MAHSSPLGSRRARERGFTYLAILIAIAILGVALAAVGTVWSMNAQREREAELLFAGNAYRTAILSYYVHGPGVSQFPQELGDLLADPRTPVPLRHLRRLYPDPMTGKADWQLIHGPDGGIIGVYSSSQKAPIKRANFAAIDAEFADAECYCDWRFEVNPLRLQRGRAKTKSQ